MPENPNENISEDSTPATRGSEEETVTGTISQIKLPDGTLYNIGATDSVHADTADYATEAGTAATATTAGSATTATTATSAGHATTADSATSAGHATTADSATTATNAGHATTADSATTATSADSATTADTATALATKRTIDGIEFNGTANVTHYATCTTAADVADKVVDCDNFKLDYGAMILVKFNYGNTAAISSVRLNVANTGAKSLYYRGADLPDTFSIRSDSVYLFVYHAPRWHLVGDTESVYDFYGTCSTAAATGTKQVTINNFKQQTGSMIVVKFNNTNTAATSSLYLQVNSEASKQIRYKNSLLSYPGMIEENRLYLFTYDGYGWQLVGNYDYLVDIATLPATTSTATYYPTITSTSGLQSLSMFDSFKYTHTKGTTSAVGNDTITLGNSTASGTASNEEGVVTLYSPGTASHTIKGASTTTNRTHTLPDATGTILNTGNVSVTPIGSTGNKIATINVAGTSSDIYAPPSDVDRYLINIETASEVTNTWADVDTMRSENRLTVIRGGANDTTFYIPEWYAGKHGVGLLMSYTDAKALISFNSNTTDIDDPIPRVTFAAGNYNNGAYESPRWYFGLTGVNGTTYDLSTFSTTDTKVTQSNATGNIDRPLMLSHDSTATTSSVTDVLYRNASMYGNPSTGIITATGFNTSTGLNYSSSGTTIPLVRYNSAGNIWVGTNDSTSAMTSSQIYLAAGFDSTNNVPFESVKIAVANSTNTGSSSYEILHKGNTYVNITSETDHWSTVDVPLTSGYVFKVLRGGTGSSAPTPPAWFSEKYGAGIVFGGSDSAGVFSVNRSTPGFTIAGGTHSSTSTKPSWYMNITGTNETTYNLDNFLSTGNTTTQSIGSASEGTAISADDITAWSAGTIPSLTTTTHSVPNITGNTSVTVKSVKTVNTVMTTATISSGVLTFSTGASVVTEDKTASNTTVGTAISIKGVNEWSAGTVPSLSYTSRTIPNISVTTVTNVLKKT